MTLEAIVSTKGQNIFLLTKMLNDMLVNMRLLIFIIMDKIGSLVVNGALAQLGEQRLCKP